MFGSASNFPDRNLIALAQPEVEITTDPGHGNNKGSIDQQYRRDMESMISVEEAKKIVFDHSQLLQPVKVQLEKACGLVLSEDLIAATDIPAFNQSSMDGYAFCFSDWKSGSKLHIAAEIPAGASARLATRAGQAFRIFTGAPLPDGADTVVMQEKTDLRNGDLIISDNQIHSGTNVRIKGSEIKSGAPALPKGSRLTAAAIGFLAGIGFGGVMAYSRPRTHLIITGNELQTVGEPLQYGQVYESNSFALKAALQQVGIQDVQVSRAEDDPDMLKGILNRALASSDLVLLTGGISAGDYDFVLQSANENGVRALFYKVKQKPGKPLYFGKKAGCLVFGLPGNPASVLTCFYEYILPAIACMEGSTENGVIKKNLPLTQDYTKSAGLTHFLKGTCNADSVTPLDGQESYRMHSFAKANCLIRIGEEITVSRKGEIVEVHQIPF